MQTDLTPPAFCVFLWESPSTITITEKCFFWRRRFCLPKTWHHVSLHIPDDVTQSFYTFTEHVQLFLNCRGFGFFTQRLDITLPCIFQTKTPFGQYQTAGIVVWTMIYTTCHTHLPAPACLPRMIKGAVLFTPRFDHSSAIFFLSLFFFQSAKHLFGEQILKTGPGLKTLFFSLF